MGEIRIVGPGKTRGYPYPVCKKESYAIYEQQILKSGPKVIKIISCSTQLSMKFFLLINVKMPTTVGILTLMSRKNSILGLYELKKSCIS